MTTECMLCGAAVEWMFCAPRRGVPFGYTVPICGSCGGPERNHFQGDAFIQQAFDMSAEAWLREQYLERFESTRTIAGLLNAQGAATSHEGVRRWLHALGIVREDRSMAVASQWKRDTLQGGPRHLEAAQTMAQTIQDITPWMSDPDKVRIIGAKIAEKKAGAGNAVFHPRSIKRTYPNMDGALLFRGSWEYNISNILTVLGKPWQYEPRHFALPRNDAGHPQTYTPDFLVDGSWLEVKGFWRDSARAKVALFRETYPDERLEIIDEPIYLALRQLFRSADWWREPHSEPNGNLVALRGTLVGTWVCIYQQAQRHIG